MAAPDRDKLRAGLAGILSGGDAETPEAPLPLEPSLKARAKRTAPTPKRSEPEVRGGAGPAPASTRSRARTTPEPEPEDEAGGDHVRTSTGYVKADGEQVHRVSLMLTKRERRELRDRAEEAELSVTDYVRRQLGL